MRDIADADERRVQALVEQDDAMWRERALNAEEALKAPTPAHSQR
ncbi:hypothetical protein ACFQ1S_22370 [Kibdelosporangium lantanae]|uniref:Uncharacterized protein n=1 Tax=Kibdelosporangium lantanae TaxID=1497396 RepID=A0ABW3MG98_9PSEU